MTNNKKIGQRIQLNRKEAKKSYFFVYLKKI